MSAFVIGLIAYFGPSAAVLVALVVAAIRLHPKTEFAPKPQTREELDAGLCKQHEHEFAGSPSMEQLAELYLIPTRSEEAL